MLRQHLYARHYTYLFIMPQFGNKCNDLMLSQGDKLPSSLFAYIRKKRKAGAFLCVTAFPALVSLGGQDLTAIVGTASLASSVGSDGLAALGADGNAGSGQLPVGATALIATGLGYFTLRDSHG